MFAKALFMGILRTLNPFGVADNPPHEGIYKLSLPANSYFDFELKSKKKIIEFNKARLFFKQSLVFFSLVRSGPVP